MPRRKIDPYGNFRFTVELGNIVVAGFSECAGLQMETKTFDYKEGGNNETTLKFPEHTSYGNVTLKRGITRATELIDWHREVVTGSFGMNPRAKNPNVAIMLMDEKGDPVRRWNLKRAFPVKWLGPDLKGSGNEIAIETLELAHEGIQLQ